MEGISDAIRHGFTLEVQGLGFKLHEICNDMFPGGLSALLHRK